MGAGKAGTKVEADGFEEGQGERAGRQGNRSTVWGGRMGLRPKLRRLKIALGE